MARLDHENRNRRGLVSERGSYDEPVIPVSPTSFSARFTNGTCAVCHQNIIEGQQIRTWDRATRKYVHTTCTETLK